jgi:hypothetical protein
MRSLKFWGVLLLALALSMSAQAASRISPYTGGQSYKVQGPVAKGGVSDTFLGLIRLFRKDRVMVVLYKEEGCSSSCTLFTSLLKDGLLCARPGTKLGFHEFVETENMQVEGGVLKSYKVKGPVIGFAFLKLWRTYPRHVRAVINKRGGLPPHDDMMMIPARDLGIPTC